MTRNMYHYTESGLDNIYLANGFVIDGPPGRQMVVIKDIDGLHRAIGRMLIDCKKNLTGREVRFLRQEMLMSQATLAKLLDVSEQAVHRWEKGKTGQVPKPAEALIRLLYREQLGQAGSSIRESLEAAAELEDAIGGARMTLSKSSKEWTPHLMVA